MKRKIPIFGLLFLLAPVCLVVWTFSTFSHSGYQNIELVDMQSDSHGWGGYEIRTGPNEAVPVAPSYIDDYYELPSDGYDAVRRSRVMVEEEFLHLEAKLRLDYAGCGIELFLDGQLFYSDFQTSLRDPNGFLILEEEDFASINAPRNIAVGLPADYIGKTLTMIVYYPFAGAWGVVVPPVMFSIMTAVAQGTAGSVVPMLWQMFWAVMMILMAVGCVGSMLSASGGSLRAKYVLLFLMYAVFFILEAYHSALGSHSGFSGQLNRIVSHLPFRVNFMGTTVLILCAVAVLGLELWENGREKRKLPVRWTVLFGLAGLWFDAMRNSTELADGIAAYLPVLLQNLFIGNWLPMAAAVSSVIIYTTTLQVIVQFVSQCVEEWKTRSRIVERSRFARENYEMIMQVDEDSRRRKHEMKHHMQTLCSLLSAREVEKAEEYIGKIIQESGQFAETAYSENIVVNSIVGIRLNQAKKREIVVQNHIHVPARLEIDDVDLNSLLSNMLENAIEACMRMEDRTGAYINLEIRKKQRFLFIECENSVDPGEALRSGQTTIKDDPKGHGFGLKTMNAVAEKYASIIQIEQEPGRFVVRTNLCLPE